MVSTAAILEVSGEGKKLTGFPAWFKPMLSGPIQMCWSHLGKLIPPQATEVTWAERTRRCPCSGDALAGPWDKSEPHPRALACRGLGRISGPLCTPTPCLPGPPRACFVTPNS